MIFGRHGRPQGGTASRAHAVHLNGYHPACLLFPRLDDPELNDLAADIRARGLIHPIVRLDGRILDGKNRLEACRIAGVEPRYVEWNGNGSPIEWVVSLNL